MPRPERNFEELQHIAVRVSDIDESIRFYTDILGYTVSERHDPGERAPGSLGMVFMRFTDDHHNLNLVFHLKDDSEIAVQTRADQARMKDLGIHHFALRVRDRAEFEAWKAWLEENGIAIVHGPVVHSPTHPEGDGTWGENRAMYFCDPDGHRIEIFCEMAKMVEETNAIEPDWYAARLRTDGADPSKHPPAPPYRSKDG